MASWEIGSGAPRWGNPPHKGRSRSCDRAEHRADLGRPVSLRIDGYARPGPAARREPTPFYRWRSGCSSGLIWSFKGNFGIHYSFPVNPSAINASSTLFPSSRTALNALSASAVLETPHTLRPMVAPRAPAWTTPAIAESDSRRFFALGPPAATTGTGELSTTCRKDATSP